jgi:hypothetical protein
VARHQWTNNKLIHTMVSTNRTRFQRLEFVQTHLQFTGIPWGVIHSSQCRCHPSKLHVLLRNVRSRLWVQLRVTSRNLNCVSEHDPMRDEDWECRPDGTILTIERNQWIVNMSAPRLPRQLRLRIGCGNYWQKVVIGLFEVTWQPRQEKLN